MTARIATIRRQCPHTGNWITAPAHYFAQTRITASDVARHGSFDRASAARKDSNHV